MMRNHSSIIVALIASTLLSCTNFQEVEIPVAFGVSENLLEFAPTLTTHSVTVSSGTKWDVTSKPEWISLGKISPSGVSPYEWVVDFSASANDEYNREGVIIIKAKSDTKEITVTQEGKKGKFIAVESVSVSPKELSLTEGESTQLTYIISPSNASIKSVSWKSSNTSVATVSQTGQVSAVAEGTATITVSTEDGNKTANCSVSVKPISVSSVSLDKESLTLKIGESSTLTATVLPENAANKKVTWSSSNTSIATVDSNGKVMGMGVGSAKITVTTDDGGKTATCSVTVNPISVTGVSLNKTSMTLVVGGSEKLTATITPTNATNKNVTWSSSNMGIATVDSNGNVAAIKVGTAIITVKTEDGGKTASCSVTVNPISVTGVSLNQTSLTMTVGDTQTLTATVTPSNATDKSVTWSSSNTSVATVSSSGVVTARAAGSATITATTVDGGKKATCSVTVQGQTVSVTGVSLSMTSLAMTVGETQTLTATISPSNATDKSVTWSSNKTSVATVSSSGVVTAKGAGSATITVKTNDGGKTATCSVTVMEATVPVTGVSLNKTSLSMTVGDTQTLTATVSPSNATDKSVTWSSSNTSVATVSSSGVVTAKAAGSATITVTTNDGGKKATCSVSVSAATVAVTGVSLNKSSLSMKVGDTQTLTATVTPSNATDKSVTWSSDNVSIASVSSSGVVTANTVGSATITVRTNDGGKTARCAVTVQATLPTMSSVTVSNIQPTSVSLSSGIVNSGDGYILEKGFCYSTSTNPDKNSTIAYVNSDWTISITGLKQNTKYYVRSFATTQYGTSYSNQTSFTTSYDPVVFGTLTIQETSFYYAKVQCGVESYGSGTVAREGFCFSTQHAPTVQNSVILCDSSSNIIVIQPLEQNTKYYLRRFVENNVGVFYGEEVSLTTLKVPDYAIAGLFSISSTQKVMFSCSNLINKASSYYFADSQYYVCGEDNLVSDAPHDILPNNTSSYFPAGGWRLLSTDEWNYLLKTRPNAKKLYAVSQVNGISGVLFFPDNWESPIQPFTPEDGFDLTSFALLEKFGAVFLPFTGTYQKGSILNFGTKAMYFIKTWSSSGGTWYAWLDISQNGTIKTDDGTWTGSSYNPQGFTYRLVVDFN